ncbi:MULTISPECIES: hypothetical protein [Vibrio]|uniref:hypothetical protein n=1 Tax=Vibrio TaxID=662 RepID=UPI001869D45A|nr:MULTISPECIES: hypothetical protein [unclassified Vibrio]EGR2692982.1 hypothetical protein [Vibrio parahaemolyticus]EGR2705850.1 hypothetical protein [Vibrio parahaemolyticus]MBE4320388.1 hypothetical protein [Vibrio parahaemolyticus]MBE4337958.1 hypothetical protein [Vibrio parahaemolyticus]MDW2184544.1 hypothetical protein [Vibrio sp. 1733]
MLKFVLGGLAGFTFTIWYVALDLNYDLDLSLAVNIVIASATVVAAAIHFESVRKQELDRIWEINKDALLELSRALSEVIEETQAAIIYEKTSVMQYLEEVVPSSNQQVYSRLKDNLSYMLNVHKPLLPKPLLKAVTKLQQQDKLTTKQVNEEGLEHEEAYQIMLENYRTVHSELNKFISKVAGVGRT